MVVSKVDDFRCMIDKCDYFREYYNVSKLDGGYIPNFTLPTNKLCAHPKIFRQRTSINEPLRNGVNIDGLINCPKNEEII